MIWFLSLYATFFCVSALIKKGCWGNHFPLSWPPHHHTLLERGASPLHTTHTKPFAIPPHLFLELLYFLLVGAFICIRAYTCGDANLFACQGRLSSHLFSPHHSTRSHHRSFREFIAWSFCWRGIFHKYGKYKVSNVCWVGRKAWGTVCTSILAIRLYVCGWWWWWWWCLFPACDPSNMADTYTQPSQKTFRTKRTLAKKLKQNRPIPYWIRLRTGNTIRYVSSFPSPFS